MPNPYIYVYPVKRVSGMLCVSQTLVEHCAPGFSLITKETRQKLGNCWLVDFAPKVVKDAEASTGYLLHQVREEPRINLTMTVDVAYLCKPHHD